jgi:hypothetical protein
MKDVEDEDVRPNQIVPDHVAIVRLEELAKASRPHRVARRKCLETIPGCDDCVCDVFRCTRIELADVIANFDEASNCLL